MRLAIALLVTALTLVASAASGAPADELPGGSIYHLAASWTDQNGQAMALRDLIGGKVIIAMGYASCPDMCPLIVANMMAIEAAAAEKHRRGLRLVFVSLDSAGDTPTTLKAFAAKQGVDRDGWLFLHGDAKAVRDLAAALGVRFRQNGAGGFDHSAILTLLGEKGEILFQQPDARIDAAGFAAKLGAF
jgi:protein SCO1/2